MDWLKPFQATPGYTLQDAIWSIATPGFWLAVSIVSGIGAFALFVSLMNGVQGRREMGLRGLDAMVIGRLGWMGGLTLGAGVRWNSGLMVAAFAIFVLAGAFMAVLIASRWCERRGSFFFKLGQISGEVAAYIRRPESATVKHR